MMTPENRATLDAAVAAWNAGELDGLARHAAPDYEWHSAGMFPGGGVHRGIDRVRRFLEDFMESWDSYTLDVQRIEEVDDERALAVMRARARGRGSGVEVDREIAYLHTVRDGKLVRTEAFLDVGEARRAAGMQGG